MAGMPYPPKCVLWENTHPKLLWVPCIPWENTHPLGGGKNTKRAWRNAMPSYEFILWVHRLLGWCTWGQVHPLISTPRKIT